jgi:hypothetical protein
LEYTSGTFAIYHGGGCPGGVIPIFTKIVFILWKVVFEKLFSILFCVCLLLKKLVNKKHFPVNEKHFIIKGKFGLISRKVFSFYLGRKTLYISCEKFRNIILFADYVKFGPQIFDCYIFCLNLFFFQFYPLKFDLIWFLY